MARNLREKIRTIIQDAYDLRSESVITKIENLIKEELELRGEERSFNYQDLSFIQSMAVKEFVDIKPTEENVGRLSTDQSMLRVLCLVNATTAFLRSKGFLYCLLKYDKK